MTLLQMSCCKEIEDVYPDRKGEDTKAAQTCVVRWNAVPALAVTKRYLPAPPPPAVCVPRSLSQATTLPG